MPNRIEGSATRRSDEGQIEYVIEPDANHKLIVKMIRNLDSDGKEAGARYAQNESFRLNDLIASLVEHGDLGEFFVGRSDPNVGFMSAVLDDMGFNPDWVRQTRAPLTESGRRSETGDGQ